MKKFFISCLVTLSASVHAEASAVNRIDIINNTNETITVNYQLCEIKESHTKNPAKDKSSFDYHCEPKVISLNGKDSGSNLAIEVLSKTKEESFSTDPNNPLASHSIKEIVIIDKITSPRFDHQFEADASKIIKPVWVMDNLQLVSIVANQHTCIGTEGLNGIIFDNLSTDNIYCQRAILSH